MKQVVWNVAEDVKENVSTPPNSTRIFLTCFLYREISFKASQFASRALAGSPLSQLFIPQESQTRNIKWTQKFRQ